MLPSIGFATRVGHQMQTAVQSAFESRSWQHGVYLISLIMNAMLCKKDAARKLLMEGS